MLGYIIPAIPYAWTLGWWWWWWPETDNRVYRYWVLTTHTYTQNFSRFRALTNPHEYVHMCVHRFLVTGRARLWTLAARERAQCALSCVKIGRICSIKLKTHRHYYTDQADIALSSRCVSTRQAASSVNTLCFFVCWWESVFCGGMPPNNRSYFGVGKNVFLYVPILCCSRPWYVLVRVRLVVCHHHNWEQHTYIFCVCVFVRGGWEQTTQHNCCDVCLVQIRYKERIECKVCEF